MKTRKIIQIATSESMAYDTAADRIDRSETIIALCNDGTLWYHGLLASSGRDLKTTGWKQIEDIPQPYNKEKNGKKNSDLCGV